MKQFSKNSITAVVVSLVLGIMGPVAPLSALAAVGVAPSLGAVGPYAIVSDTWTNTLNAGLETAVIGGVCYTTPPGTAPVSINGVTTTPLSLAVVPCTNGAAQASALADLNAQAADASCISLGTNVVLSGTYTPGCYKSSGTMDITLSTTVTLSGQGIYIFKSGGALTTGANSIVALTNGALAQNVYWVPGGAASLGANSASSLTPTFVGNIIADALGSTGINLGHFVNIRGRLLAFGHTVTTDSNTITVPTSLHVIKLVVNGSGGTAVASNFNVHVKNASGTEMLGGPFPGAAAPGTTYALSAGTYVVSEDPNTSYVTTFTGTGCDSSGNVTLATGDDKFCTIVNTDIAPPPPLVPGPIGGGGIIIPNIGLVKVPTPLSLPAGAGSVTYYYTAWNVGGQQALTKVTVVDDKCSPLVFLSGDLNNNNQLDPHENWNYSCTTTLSKTTTNTAVATGWGSGQAAIATALATVVVSAPLTPPLINIVKVPSRLTPLPFGGGEIIYNYTVTNPGVVPMHDVVVSDDKCGGAVVSGPFGDGNGNGLLDPGESWSYACAAHIAISTRNVVTAEGRANGFVALGYAFSTVLVSAPGFPNTGISPRIPGALASVVILSLLIVSLSILYVLRKKQVA